MSQQQVLFGLSSAFNVDSADFDNSTDGTAEHYGVATNASGFSDGKQGSLSLWLRKDGGDGFFQIFLGSGLNGNNTSTVFRARFHTNNTFNVVGENAAGTVILQLNTTSTILAGSSWRHFLVSWDLANASNRHLYLDGSSNLSVATYTDDTLKYTGCDWSLGAFPASDSGFVGCMAELWFSTTYIDFSQSANRDAFRNGSKPARLGSDGTVLGITPQVYCHLDDGETATNFALNRGSSDDFSTFTGTLSTGSSSPSD